MNDDNEPALFEDEEGKMQPCYCRHCGEVILRGQPRYTAAEPEHFAHYSCHEANVKGFEDSLNDIKERYATVEKTLKAARAALDIKGFDRGR